jgi:hypothetical protein
MHRDQTRKRLVSSVSHRLQAWIEAVHVAVVASWRDLRTASGPVPSRVGPFDAGLVAQVYDLLEAERWLSLL